MDRPKIFKEEAQIQAFPVTSEKQHSYKVFSSKTTWLRGNSSIIVFQSRSNKQIVKELRKKQFFFFFFLLGLRKPIKKNVDKRLLDEVNPALITNIPFPMTNFNDSKSKIFKIGKQTPFPCNCVSQTKLVTHFMAKPPKPGLSTPHSQI